MEYYIKEITYFSLFSFFLSQAAHAPPLSLSPAPPSSSHLLSVTPESSTSGRRLLAPPPPKDSLGDGEQNPATPPSIEIAEPPHTTPKATPSLFLNPLRSPTIFSTYRHHQLAQTDPSFKTQDFARPQRPEYHQTTPSLVLSALSFSFFNLWLICPYRVNNMSKTPLFPVKKEVTAPSFKLRI
ncbi:hypothetical protein RchiOBHm_Chr5g0047771 [Rosa chinensis]|uniref:Uncharacterized protein n=1 Tax=Rosa chinensis TaxID=74649 RepID=A0A2P6QEF2_ROSCH|nr:hypothetical protein RchiOBHm_Chr5g0047771 [Rosa chinensis]